MSDSSPDYLIKKCSIEIIIILKNGLNDLWKRSFVQFDTLSAWHRILITILKVNISHSSMLSLEETHACAKQHWIRERHYTKYLAVSKIFFHFKLGREWVFEPANHKRGFTTQSARFHTLAFAHLAQKTEPIASEQSHEQIKK